MVIWNDEIPTRRQLINQNTIRIELTIVSNNIAGECHWSKIEVGGASDHYVYIEHKIKQTINIKRNE